jgi:hypothetical protein
VVADRHWAKAERGIPALLLEPQQAAVYRWPTRLDLAVLRVMCG